MNLDITIYAESIDDISSTGSKGLAIDINNADVESLLNSLETSDLVDYIINRTDVYEELYDQIKDNIEEAKYASVEKI